MSNPIVTITMESGGIIEGELYPDKAPQSVRNFIDLCNHNFYDGLIFHRVIPGFMIQGGCPQGTGMGGPGYCIKGELYPDKAPNTVNNFISLANKGFYDGLTFHRVIPGFMIQGGCPNGNGMGGPGYEINGEFSANGFKQNDLLHTTGVLSMARTMAPNSAGSQFFIMVAPAPHLDGQYAAFGQVTEGQDIAIDISRVPRNMMNDKPKKDQVIQSIRVDTQGVEYPAPETH